MPKAAFMWIDDEIKMRGKKKKQQANKWEFSWRPRKTHNAQQICRFPVLHTFMRSQTLVWVKTQAKLKSTGANNLWPFLPVWFQSSSCTQCKRKQGTGPALVWWKKTLNYDKGWHDFASTLCSRRLIYPGSSGNSCVSGWCWGSGHQTEPSCSSWSSPGPRLTFFSCWRSAQDQQHVSNA